MANLSAMEMLPGKWGWAMAAGGHGVTLATLNELIRRFPRKWLLFTASIAGVVTSLSIVLIGNSLKLLTDSAVAGDLRAFLRNVAAVLAVLGVRAGASWLGWMSRGYYAEAGVARIREDVVGHFTAAQMAEIDRYDAGDFISRLTTDLDRTRRFAQDDMNSLIATSLTGLLVFAYLCWLNWKLTVLMTLSVPVIVYAGSVFTKGMEELSREAQEHLAAANSVARDALAGVEVVKAFNLAEIMDHKYDQAISGAVGRGILLAKKTSLLAWSSQSASNLPFAILFAAGGWWVIKGSMTAGGLVAFLNLFSYLTMPVSQIPGLLGRVKTEMAVTGRVFDILRLEEEPRGGPVTAPRASDEVIDVQELTFAYRQNQPPVLRGISFSVRQGEKVAIVGPTGSGKSTLFKLLLGLYPASSGSVEVLGHPVTAWDLAALRDHVALVTQDTWLFSGTIYENIALGRPSAGRDDVIRAAKLAGIHDFVASLPAGYDTQVGELGGRLSGGQRQKIVIARAILKDAAVLLLDEPTASLDAESELEVQRALDQLVAGRTCLTIAHRLSTVLASDRILVLDQGVLVEQGTHAELLDRNGLYKRLYTGQLASGRGGES